MQGGCPLKYAPVLELDVPWAPGPEYATERHTFYVNVSTNTYYFGCTW